MAKLYTIDEIKNFGKFCYSNRWTIGKDNFSGMFVMIYLLEKYETVENLKTYLNSIEMDDNYPL
jgi:hypothetical protein